VQLFLDAAQLRGWRPPSSGPIADRLRAIAGYAAMRSKWFDEQFIAAGANGIDQAVILAAGLDSRAWRLPWVDGTVVYEIDQPGVLAFKADTLAAHHARPVVEHRAVPVDLRQDWPKALRQAGFDTSTPTVWAAEGLLPYLPAAAQDLLFERVAELSATGSRVAVESFGPDFFDPQYQDRRRLPGDGGTDVRSPDDLWFLEERTDLVAWLAGRGWAVTATESAVLMERYGRSAENGVPRTVFVEGRLPG
jgi:methyltransferase (TIGR00027 family)